MIFHMVRFSEFLPNNNEIETIIFDLFRNYMSSVQHSAYNELVSHIKTFDKSASQISKSLTEVNKSSSESSSGSESEEEASEADKKKKKKTFKNFFKKLKIEKKKKKNKLATSNSQEEVMKIFDVAKKVVSILNKIQVVEFLFDRIVSNRILLNERVISVTKNEIRSFCQELEEQFYEVMEKLIQFYSSKMTEKNVADKNAVFLVPSVETCALLNILGMFWLRID